MLVKIIEEEMLDGRNALTIVIDDETAFNVYDEEIEDNSLKRTFYDCYKIETLMRRAYEAGKVNEKISFISKSIVGEH